MMLNDLGKKEIYHKIMDFTKLNSIPVESSQNFMGFGKYEGFFLYYISLVNDRYAIKIRINYQRDTENNILVYDLNDETCDVIINKLSSIYQKYLHRDTSIKDLTDEPAKNYEINLHYSRNYLEYETNKSLIDALERLKLILNNSSKIYSFSNKMSNRLENALHRANIFNMNDLCKKDYMYIIKVRGLGRKSISELIKLINNFVQSRHTSTSAEEPRDKIITSRKHQFQSAKYNNKQLMDLYERYKTIDKKIDYTSQLQEILTLSTEIIDSKASNRDKEILMEFYFDKTNPSLQKLGDKYHLSRERIRQITNKLNRILKSRKKNTEYNFDRLITIFNTYSDDGLIDFIVNGILKMYTNRFSKILLSNIYGKLEINLDKRAVKTQLSQSDRLENVIVEIICDSKELSRVYLNTIKRILEGQESSKVALLYKHKNYYGFYPEIASKRIKASLFRLVKNKTIVPHRGYKGFFYYTIHANTDTEEEFISDYDMAILNVMMEQE